jgi:hypothetical protein
MDPGTRKMYRKIPRKELEDDLEFCSTKAQMLDELILTLFENLDPDRQDELQKSGIMDDWSTIEKTERVIDEILKSEWCLTEDRRIRRQTIIDKLKQSAGVSEGRKKRRSKR